MIGKRIAPYEITSHLGSGGMGDVFEATDSRLGRRVAVKFLGESFLERTLVPGIKTSAKYSTTGHLIFGRNDMLMAQRFDAGRLELSRDPFPIAEMSSPPRPIYSVSTNGGVSYLPVVGTGESRLCVGSPPTTSGGVSPRWRPDGTELYYLSPDSTVMAVSIKKTGSSLEVGAPHPLFKVSLSSDDYNVSADGRFLVNDVRRSPVANRVAVILNWMSGVKK